MSELAARCVVEIDGTRYDSRDKDSQLSHVSADLDVRLTGESRITFADPHFEITDRHLDSTGMRYAEARVWFGYGEDLGEAFFGGKLIGCEHDSRYATLKFHARRRASFYTDVLEDVSRDEIAARDKNLCHVCGLWVSIHEVTLDHVVPLIKGGTHTADNIKIAHRECNSRKGKR